MLAAAVLAGGLSAAIPVPASAAPGLPARLGYLLTGRDGGVFAFGAAPYVGSPRRPAQPVVAVAATPSGRGYWLAARDGGVFAFGAPFRGSAAGMRLGGPIVGFTPTWSGLGYWLVGSDGGVLTFGDAPFLGSAGGIGLSRPVVAMAATPTSRGYWLVASDGGVFAFGDAAFHGSMGGTRLVAPIVGMAPSPTGGGYWLAASDGGVFAFGDAPFAGSVGGRRLAAPIAGMAAAPRPPAAEVGAFYYPWYGTPATDGFWRHWEQNGHHPPDDIGADYYPAAGAYSSADPGILDAHMAMMAGAGVTEVVSSWWGRGSYEHNRLPAVAAAARRHSLDLGIILEPYAGRTPASARADVEHLETFGVRDVYVYESLGEDPAAWNRANAGHAGVRMFGHSSDTGAMRSGASLLRARQGGFDGVFTYDPLGYTPADYATICAHARALALVCAPSVAPGFEAVRATGNPAVRPRASGATYDEQWTGAIDAAPGTVTITSFNEWHEGTQIEPAQPRQCLENGFCYGDYEGAYGRTGAGAAMAYLDRTAVWVGILRQ